jgi:hypothetical protein
MKKNGLLQTFFYDFLKIQMTNYGSFEKIKKGTSAIHGATFFFLSKRAWRSEKGAWHHKKGAWRRTILFFFSLTSGECHTLCTYATKAL